MRHKAVVTMIENQARLGTPRPAKLDSWYFTWEHFTVGKANTMVGKANTMGRKANTMDRKVEDRGNDPVYSHVFLSRFGFIEQRSCSS